MVQGDGKRNHLPSPHVWGPFAMTLGASPAAGAAPAIIAGAGAAASDGAGAGASASKMSESQHSPAVSILTYGQGRHPLTRTGETACRWIVLLLHPPDMHLHRCGK